MIHFSRFTNFIRRRPEQSGSSAAPANSRANVPSLNESRIGRSASASSSLSQGWHISPTTPTLRIMNPDLPMPTPKPGPDIHKALPELPPSGEATPHSPMTPLSPTRSGSPDEDVDLRSVVYSQPATPVDEAAPRRILRVTNPDPMPPGYVPNFSRPFGPDNPFPDRPFRTQMQPPTSPQSPRTPLTPHSPSNRPIPYRPGLDANSPLYMGAPPGSLPRRQYSHFAPVQTPRARPPLSLVIPTPIRQGMPQRMIRPVSQHASLSGMLAGDIGSPPAKPMGRPPRHSRRTPVVNHPMETIVEREESPPRVKRKAVPRYEAESPTTAPAVPRAPASSQPGMLRVLRRLDPRTWGKGPSNA